MDPIPSDRPVSVEDFDLDKFDVGMCVKVFPREEWTAVDRRNLLARRLANYSAERGLGWIVTSVPYLEPGLGWCYTVHVDDEAHAKIRRHRRKVETRRMKKIEEKRAAENYMGDI